jgi:hypothetical protein
LASMTRFDDETLEQQVGPAAEISLHRARRHADDRTTRNVEEQAKRLPEIRKPLDSRATTSRAWVVGSQPNKIAKIAIGIRCRHPCGVLGAGSHRRVRYGGAWRGKVAGPRQFICYTVL